MNSVSQNAETDPSPTQVSKVILLICLPLLISSFVSIWLILHLVDESERKQSLVIGEAIATQLASSVSEYLISEDRLSLTVLLNDLVQQGVFNKATIFGADNSLVATAGDSTGSASTVYTAEIPYQDSVAGYVRISLAEDSLFTNSSTILFWTIILNLVLLVSTGFYANYIAQFLLAPRPDSSRTTDNESTGLIPKRDLGFSLPIIKASTRFDRKAPNQDADFDNFSILVLKIRPPRVFDNLSNSIKQVASLHKGRIKSFDDEITLLFTQPDQHCFHAICAALVIQSLTRESGFAEYKAGIDCGTEKDEVKQARKKASYYASVAQNELLVSKAVYLHEHIQGKARISEFHSSMAPDSQLYRIDGLKESHQKLIDSQARQLDSL